MLMYVDLSSALEEQQLDVAANGARELQLLGRELGDPTFVALGFLVEGLAEIRRGHLREGFALLDEAMLPVLADTVVPEFAGHIYCTIIAICRTSQTVPAPGSGPRRPSVGWSHLATR